MIRLHLPRRASTALRLLAVALAFGLGSSAWAQVVSSGLTGIVRAGEGTPVTGATVTATHVPTGTVYRATTSGSGRYNFNGILPGGPYTVVVEAQGYRVTEQNGIQTELGATGEANVTLEATGSDVVSMERFVVQADQSAIDATAVGAGGVLTSARLLTKPTSERSLADMVSANPMVTIRSFGGDREEAQITAVGQNNRFNSVQIDGARINDQFGLNATGLASFFNPLSLEWVDQLSVQLSPYDGRQAGFTGASINAVTKRGTNEFKGATYYYFQGDSLLGFQLRGENVRENVISGTRVIPRLERESWGAYLGGPIIPNRLFFFVGYEKFDTLSAGRDPRLGGSTVEQQILTRFNTYATTAGRTINWGNPVTGQTVNAAEDEKLIAKLDLKITNEHQASFRYLKAEGMVPQFGNYGNATLNNYLTLSGGPVTGSDGHFYAQERVEESYSGQLFSQWTPDLNTEVKFARVTQDQLTPINTVAPQVAIYGLSGVDLTTGRSVTNGVYIAGTEQFRQGNEIAVETTQMGASGNYTWGDFVFSGGFEREQSDFYNLFRQGSYGLVAFSSVANFLNDVPTRIERNVYDPTKRVVGDISEFATTGLFGQAKWDVSDRLSLLGSIRYEWNEQPVAPTLNTVFQEATGFRNDGTLDGADYISPRVGFNLGLDEDRTLQLRGGVGHFTGRVPWVFFSNSYGQTGIGGFTQVNQVATGQATSAALSFTEYLRRFDPSAPIGTATEGTLAYDPARGLVVDRGTGTLLPLGTAPVANRREINWADDGIKLPSVWRANLALDKKVPFLSTNLTIEAVFTKNIDPIFISNENLLPLTNSSGVPLPSADGRARFAGQPSSGTNAATVTTARYKSFTDLYRIRNADGGASTYVGIVWARPVKDKWGFDLAYTRGRSTEVQANGQTTASGQWQRNVVFNQSQVEVGTSDFEIKNRVQASVTREFEFITDAPTRASLYYEGRSGNPYSFVYTTDLNGDGRNDNDTMTVPADQADSRFSFGHMTQAQVQDYFRYLSESGLSAYGGGVAPKNAFNEPWVNRLDLKVAQEIPVRGRAKLEVFFDFINFGSFLSRDFFGYYEEASTQSNDVFRRRTLGGAQYNTAGLIQPALTATFRNNTTGAITTSTVYTNTPTPAAGTSLVSVTVPGISNLVIDNGQSRWRIQIGARLKF